MSECNCKKDKCLSPAVLQINNQDCPTVFHRVTFPAAMGDDETNPPRNGQYRNVLLVYEANGHVYMFSSDGIPTLISDGAGTTDYNRLSNKPSIEGHELVDDSSLEDIGVIDAIEEALEDYTPTSDLAEVAFSGDYDDLIGTPTIPVVNDATLTITRNGTSAGTFTANSANNTTIDISVPTTTNDLTNNSGFITNTVNNLVNYYTKSESDATFVPQTRTVNNKALSSDITLTASDVGALPDSTVIPTVNDATLTITQNGTSAGTFTANASSNATINLTDTTYSDFSGATSSVAGASGLVPAPIAGDEDKALKGDGTWSVVGDVVELFVNRQPNSLSTPFEIYKSDGSTPITHSEMRELFIPSNKKTVVLHDTTSYDGVYPVIEFCYDTTEFYIFDAVYSSTYYIASAPGGGNTDFAITRTDLQKKLTAGSNITISGDTISASVELVEMSYGESNAWAKFIAAYNAHSIVYCRASSNANPASGSQTRKAFMAYVNNAENPTSVEFQYVRSVSSKTASQPVDQVFVYTLTNASGGTWTVTSRNMAPKLAAGTNTTVNYSNGTYTVNATVPTPTVFNMTYDTTATTWTDTDIGITLQETPYGTFPDVRERIQTFAVPTPVFTNASTGSTLNAEGLYNLLETGADVVLNGVPVGVRLRRVNSTTTFTVGSIVCDGVRLTKVGPFHIEYFDPDTSELVYSMDLSSYSATVSANAVGTTMPTLLPFAIRVYKRVTFDSEVSPDPQTEYAFEIQGTSHNHTDAPT